MAKIKTAPNMTLREVLIKFGAVDADTNGGVLLDVLIDHSGQTVYVKDEYGHYDRGYATHHFWYYKNYRPEVFDKKIKNITHNPIRIDPDWSEEEKK